MNVDLSWVRRRSCRRPFVVPGLVTIYVIANFHHVEVMWSAYKLDHSSDKVLFCSREIRDFLVQFVDPGDVVETFSMPSSFWGLLRKAVATLRPGRSWVRLVTLSPMGAQNIIAAARFRVQEGYYTSQLSEFELQRLEVLGFKQQLGRILLSTLLRARIQVYQWDHLTAYGLGSLTFQPPKEIISFPRVTHDFDAILLDIDPEEYGLDVETTVISLKGYIAQFKKVAIKQHPRLPMGIGRLMDLPAAPSVPAELLAHERTTVLYLVSASVVAFENRINVLPLMTFRDPHSREAVLGLIERHARALGVAPVVYCEKDSLI